MENALAVLFAPAALITCACIGLFNFQNLWRGASDATARSLAVELALTLRFRTQHSPALPACAAAARRGSLCSRVRGAPAHLVHPHAELH